MRKMRLYTPFGVKVKTELCRKGITAKALAEELDIKPTVFSEVLTGRNNKQEHRIRIAERLGIKE